MAGGQLDGQVARVVRRQLCTGCGGCTRLDRTLQMRMDENGFLRPARDPDVEAPIRSRSEERDLVRVFRAMCPGVGLDARRLPGPYRHPTMGRYLEAWTAWATDPETRFRGSSGGALTALSGWLAEQGTPSVGARSCADNPRRTVSVQITSREEALASAGSRYNPVATAAHPDSLQPDGAVVGKPCEVAALRQLSRDPGEQRPLLMSFFCAGTPSQHATQAVLDRLGVGPEQPLREMWFRGRGWPGRFSAVTADGVRSMSYDESWGAVLGPEVQWRCKICPDGVGEFSDLSAADFWEADDQGYPVFDEGEGRSALVVRTARGQRLLRAAVEAGVIGVEPLDLDALAQIQPFQRTRRSTVTGRTLGSRLGGRPAPRYRGLGLWRLAATALRQNIRAARGTFRRVRSAR